MIIQFPSRIDKSVRRTRPGRSNLDLVELAAAAIELKKIIPLLEEINIRLAQSGCMIWRPFTSLNHCIFMLLKIYYAAEKKLR